MKHKVHKFLHLLDHECLMEPKLVLDHQNTIPKALLDPCSDNLDFYLFTSVIPNQMTNNIVKKQFF